MKNLLTLFIIATSQLSIFKSDAQGVLLEYKISAGDPEKSVSGTSKTYSQNGNSRTEMNMSIPGLPAGAFNTISITRSDKPNMIVTLNPENKTYTEMTYEESKPEEHKSTEPFEVALVGKETVIRNYPNMPGL